MLSTAIALPLLAALLAGRGDDEARLRALLQRFDATTPREEMEDLADRITLFGDEGDDDERRAAARLLYSLAGKVQGSRPALAVELHGRVEEWYRDLGEDPSADDVALSLGSALADLRRFDEALQVYERIGGRVQARQDPERRLILANNRAVALRGLQDLEAAIQEYRSAQHHAEVLGDRRRIATLSLNLGSALNAQGRYDEALREFLRAEEDFAALGSEFEEAAVAFNRAAVYSALGRFEDVIRVLNDIEGAFERAGRTGERGKLLAMRGQARGRCGELERGRADLERADQLFAQLGIESLRSYTQLLRLELDEQSLEPARLVDEARRIQARCDAPAERSLRMSAHQICGRQLIALGRLEEAEHELEAARELALQLRIPHALPWLDDHAAVIARRRGEPALGLRRLSEAAQRVEQLLSLRVQGIGLENGQHLREACRSFPAHAMECLSSIERPSAEQIATAYHVLQVFHGLGMALLLAEGQSFLDALPEDLRSSSEELKSRRHALDMALATQARSPRSASLRERARLREEHDALQQDERAFAEILRLRRPLLDDLYPRPARLAEVQARLPERTTLIEFLSLGDTYCFVVTRERAQALCLGPTQELLEPLEVVLDALDPGRGGEPDRILGDRERQALDSLSQRILRPVLDAQPHDRSQRLWIAPDGALSRLPFELLPDPDAPTPTPLVARTALTYVHSGTVPVRRGVASRAVEDGAARLVAFGDPGAGVETEARTPEALLLRSTGRRLPMAAREVLSIARYFATEEERAQLDLDARSFDEAASKGPAGLLREGERFLVALGSAASEQRLQNAPLVQRADVVHLACHASGDPISPTLSFLDLGARSEEEDGLLRYRELAGLRLQARLMVLSACSTHAGPLQTFEGVVGLGRAALAGGAGSVLSTLWQVPDGAAHELLLDFYREWLVEEKPLSEALAQAKRAAIQRGVPASSWAAFVLWSADGGDPSR